MGYVMGIIVVAMLAASFWQEVSPEAQKCHRIGGHYYLVDGCFREVSIPLNPK